MKKIQKTIEYQGRKQRKAIKNNKKQQTNNNADDYTNEVLISNEREIVKNIYNETLVKIEELTKKINFDNLKYFTELSNMETDFSFKKVPITFLNDIKTNKIIIEQANVSQEDLNKYLKIIWKGNKSDQQKRNVVKY